MVVPWAMGPAGMSRGCPSLIPGGVKTHRLWQEERTCLTDLPALGAAGRLLDPTYHKQSVSQWRETGNEEESALIERVCEVKFSLTFPRGHIIQARYRTSTNASAEKKKLLK